MADDRETLASRLRLTVELHEEGVQIMRQNLRREDPDATDAEIERRLQQWLTERPGAEFGDGAGRPGTWPRR